MSVLFLYGRNYSSSLKMPWIMLIMSVPVAGLVFYLLVGLNSSTHKMKKHYKDIDEVLLPKLSSGNEAQKLLNESNPYIANVTRYIKNYSGYPLYHGSKVTYYDDALKGLNLFLNNRDHRKITVIDGNVGFTGGYNLADEYFHRREPFGFWKDTGIKLEGETVKNLTVTFLEMWNAVSLFSDCSLR